MCKQIAPEPKPDPPGLAWWAILSIVIGVVAIAGGLSYASYRLYKAKKSH